MQRGRRADQSWGKAVPLGPGTVVCRTIVQPVSRAGATLTPAAQVAAKAEPGEAAPEAAAPDQARLDARRPTRKYPPADPSKISLAVGRVGRVLPGVLGRGLARTAGGRVVVRQPTQPAVRGPAV
jgi:hypothetical protein